MVCEYIDQGDCTEANTQYQYQVVCLMVGVSDILENQIECSAIRASAPGGQNAQQVSTAIHFRFDVKSASLQETVKSALLGMRDARINIDVPYLHARERRASQRHLCI